MHVSTYLAAMPPHGKPLPEMPAIEALIFDMDGTMVHSMPWHTQAWVEYARRHAMDLDVPAFMVQTTGKNAFECACALMGRTVSAEESERITAEKEGIYRKLFAANFCAVDGFARFHAQARDMGLKVAIGTAGDQDNVRFVLNNLQMQPPAQAIARGDEGLPGKPHPDIFLKAAERLAIDPAACIVFEDAPHGIEAARRAGMRAVGIGTTHDAQQLSGPHVLAWAPDFSTLLNNQFLEKLHDA